MQQESSQSDLAERDVPTRSRARFPGGAAEGAGAERVCLSVRPCVCLSGTQKPSSFRLDAAPAAMDPSLSSSRFHR
ncbi:RAC-gamma serine/threonine-protein kinase isoform X1 [Xyrichtys novacula]|uniref:RAC-gamma serine/threonine-protein kinase isoform X1 n=1 Tax=Xyrichtys novacula TaxID=13765 RepID=A0AAV1EWE9_XYRNO|nr:RAC-gamma serine/threonine-protein kinase isoform X1 [Xyrichtys novacula]